MKKNDDQVQEIKKNLDLMINIFKYSLILFFLLSPAISLSRNHESEQNRALFEYFNNISSLEKLTKPLTNDQWLIAQNRTVVTLRSLDIYEQKIIIDFLRKLGLLSPINGPGLLNKANLSKINLSGLDLSGVDLSGADLSRADLSGADLSRANLSGANLSNSNIGYTDFKNADLRGTNLSNSNASSVSKNNRPGFGASPFSMSLRQLLKVDASFSGTDFRGAKLDNINFQFHNLSGANFMGTNLRSVDLRNSNLRGANLMGVNLSDKNLSSIDFSNTDLKNANLLNADLSGAKFTNTDLSDTKLCGQATELCTPPFPTTYSFLGFTMSDSNRVKLCGTKMPNKKFRNDDCPRIAS